MHTAHVPWSLTLWILEDKIWLVLFTMSSLLSTNSIDMRERLLN